MNIFCEKNIVWLDCIGHDMTTFRPEWAVM